MKSNLRASKWALLAGGSVIAALGAAQPTWANCSPVPSVQNSTTTCVNASEPVSLTTSGSTLEVKAGATIAADPGSAVRVETRQANIIIDGSVSSTGAAAIVVQNGSPVLNFDPYAGASGPNGNYSYPYEYPNGYSSIAIGEQGTVTGTAAIRIEQSSSNYLGRSTASISNSGKLIGTQGPAVVGAPSDNVFYSTISNTETGFIGGVAASVQSINNLGTIEGAGAALTLGRARDPFFGSYMTSVINDGTIRSGGLSTIVSGQEHTGITNSGSITNSSRGYAIAVDRSLGLLNSGVINGNITTGGGFASQIDSTLGTINGDVLFGSGDDILVAVFDDTGAFSTGITGNIDGGAGLNLIDVKVATDATAVAPAALPTNFQSLKVSLSNNAQLTLASSYQSETPFEIVGIGSLLNKGRIETIGRAVKANGNFSPTSFKIVNSGTITSSLSDPADGTISLDGGRLENGGTIQAAGGSALLMGSASTTVINTGVIKSLGGAAIVLTGGYGDRLQVIQNGGGGVIEGASNAIEQTGAGASFGYASTRIENAGTINGNVDLTASPSADFFVMKSTGVVNGNVLLGEGDDLFFADDSFGADGFRTGITGVLDGGTGVDRLLARFTQDANATFGSFAAFEAVELDVGAGKQVNFGGTLSGITLDLVGRGTSDLSVDLSGVNAALINGGAYASSLPGQPYHYPDQVGSTIISRGVLQASFDPSRYGSVVALDQLDTFTNEGSISLQQTVVPYGSGAAAIGGGLQVTNNGQIAFDGGSGISGALTVINDGSIVEADGSDTGVGVSRFKLLTNNGSILTSGVAIDVGNYSDSVVRNAGLIASSAAQAILGSSSYGVTRIVNDAGGVISGGAGFDAIALSGTGVLANEGTINGDVTFGYDPYGYGYSYGDGIFVDRGGAVNGNLTFGSGNDIFVATSATTGVTATIDAGAGVDTFIRSYGVDTTVDLGLLGATPESFERHGVGASGVNTVVTLNGASGTLTAPLTLVGDGTIINMVNVAPSTLFTPRRVVTLGTQADPLNVAGAGSTLSFINRATLGNGVSGYARSFANEGTISSGRQDVTSVNLLASDPTKFVFSNTGLIAGAERAPYYSYSPIGVTLGSADPSILLANAEVTNSGTIAGGFAIDLKAKQFVFDNSGTITRGNLSAPSLSISVRAPYGTIDATAFNGDSVSINNSGTIRSSANIDTVAKTFAFTNSGIIGSTELAASASLSQNGLQTFDPAVQGYSVADQETAILTNSGTIYGNANLFSTAKAVNVANSGTMALGVSSEDEADRTGGTVLSLEISTQGSQSVNVSNSGAISTTHLGSGALLVAGYTLDGEYGYDENGEAATPVQGAPTSTITINNAGTIRADGGALYQPATLSPFPWYPDSSEYVQPNIALTVTGASLGGADISVTNEAGGVVSAIGITRLFDGTDAAIPSAFETIGSTAFVASANTVSLVNAGTIQGLSGGIVPTGVSIELDSADYNYSDRYMAGAIQTFASVDTITNTKSGVIIGSVDLGTMNDSLVNFGTVNGDIFLRGGNDSMIQNIGGVLNGVADGGAGTDALLLDITGGGLLNQATLDKFVNFETTTITGTGTVTTSGPFTADSLVLRDANLTLAAGNILETASDVALIFAGGTNSLLNLGTIKGSIVTSAATTRIVNQGQISGPLTLGDGDDELTIGSGASFTGPVNAGAGNDILIISGGGSDAAPLELALSPFTGFERLLQDSGTVSMSGAFTTGIFDLVGGRFIGRAGSAFTADRINVAQGTTFGSAGTVNGNIAVQGILSPGSSPGTMTVNGSVALAGGSTTLFEMTPTVSDAVIINGALSIASGTTLKIVGERPLTPGLTYSLITASGGISGAFTTTDKASTVLGFLRQTANSIDLLGQFVLAPGSNPQVVRSVDYVNGLLLSGSAPSGVINAIPSLLTADGTANPAAFARLNAEPYAAASQIGIENGLAVAAALRSANMASQADAPGLFSFGQALGGWRRLPGTTSAGTSRADISTQGLLAGIGLSSGALSIGGFVGYIDARQHVGPLGSKTDADGMLAGVVGQAAFGGWLVAASLTYDGSAADTDRVLIGGAKTSAHYRLHGWTGDVSIGHAFAFGNGWALRPEVGFTHISSRRGSASETGGGALSLDVNARRTKASFISGAFTLKGEPGAGIRPWLSAGLRHQLDADAVYASAGLTGVSAHFAVPGAARNRTLATIGAGASAQVAPGTTLFAGVNSEFGADSSGESANLGLRVQF